MLASFTCKGIGEHEGDGRNDLQTFCLCPGFHSSSLASSLVTRSRIYEEWFVVILIRIRATVESNS